MKFSFTAALATATLALCAPVASAYDVNVGIDPQFGPVCQITDSSGAQSVLKDQSDAVVRMNSDIRTGLRNDLPSGVRKNFNVVDRLTDLQMQEQEIADDDINAGQKAFTELENSATAAGWNQQELNIASYPAPEEQIPTLLIPQAQASQFLESENLYKTLAESTLSSNGQVLQMMSDRGAKVASKAIGTLNSRMQKVTEGSDDAALRSSLQLCADGVSAQDGAYDASVTQRLPLTGGFGSGSAAGLAGLAGIALLLVVCLTVGGAKLHN
ncbi:MULTISPECIES: hypothetical protein [Corynebacterium]|uniref:hypothetical protein n=1 Tax=Corynebacterium TaxID=1716 RepID=UPI0008A1CFE6|nr:MULTISPECIES: hypothetical protein [Corynebacterium]MCT1441840.1 hypothetical protein [Corynebacterium glucuronolyticum]OFO43043.1 hypothetical protein HMPREF3044_04445 [Corynebacterium sp. HMSC073D01]